MTDIRASEDQSSDPTITEQSFDTKLPLNINDEDIWPGMTEPPKEHEGCTEMTFDLIRYEVGNTARFLTYTPPGVVLVSKRGHENTSIEDKERLIEKLGQYLEAKYLRHCDMSIPLQWVAANVARLVGTSDLIVLPQIFTKDVYRYWRRCGSSYTTLSSEPMEVPVFLRIPKIDCSERQ